MNFYKYVLRIEGQNINFHVLASSDDGAIKILLGYENCPKESISIKSKTEFSV